jgi:mono/diheme cytochrome c family protein
MRGTGPARGVPAGMLLLALLLSPSHHSVRAGAAELAHDPAFVREGYRRYQGVCGHCHGPDGSGSSFAPGLIDPLPSRERFAAAVLEGVSGPSGAMRGFAGDPNVEPYVNAMYAYLVERASGRLGRGRPGTKVGPRGR